MRGWLETPPSPPPQRAHPRSTFITGSIANQLEQFLKNPASFLTVLGTSAPQARHSGAALRGGVAGGARERLPRLHHASTPPPPPHPRAQTAIFFSTYIMLQALWSQPLELVRWWALASMSFKARLAPTQRAREELWTDQARARAAGEGGRGPAGGGCGGVKKGARPCLPPLPTHTRHPVARAPAQTQGYGDLIPDDTMTLLLGLTFCCVCPIITPLALLYFFVTLVVYKYNFLHVYGREYESGGQVRCACFFGGGDGGCGCWRCVQRCHNLVPHSAAAPL